MQKNTNLIVALDFPEPEVALDMARSVNGVVKWLKVGKQLFTKAGPEIVRKLQDLGFSIFLDLKFHDIPNTVSGAIKSAAGIGADMVNVHATGGKDMLVAAAQAGEETGIEVVAVTVLTSLDKETLEDIGVGEGPEQQVKRLSLLAENAGIDGVVCSAQEIPLIRGACSPNFRLVVPGIRPKYSGQDDQKRVMTPPEAANAGADFIVVGRPITKAENPRGVAQDIFSSI